jgi:hypothetical protein
VRAARPSSRNGSDAYHGSWPIWWIYSPVELIGLMRDGPVPHLENLPVSLRCCLNERFVSDVRIGRLWRRSEWSSSPRETAGRRQETEPVYEGRRSTAGVPRIWSSPKNARATF